MRKQYPYKNDFNKYTEKFKEYINKLEKDKISAQDIIEPGVGVKTFIKNKKLKGDFKGLYALWENDEVVYVGISKNVIARLYDHIKSSTHYTATFAVKIMKTDNGYDGSRSDITSKEIKEVIDDRISEMDISYVKLGESDDEKFDTELYLFEVYAAIYYQTKYNTFETH